MKLIELTLATGEVFWFNPLKLVAIGPADRKSPLSAHASVIVDDGLTYAVQEEPASIVASLASEAGDVLIPE